MVKVDFIDDPLSSGIGRANCGAVGGGKLKIGFKLDAVSDLGINRLIAMVDETGLTGMVGSVSSSWVDGKLVCLGLATDCRIFWRRRCSGVGAWLLLLLLIVRSLTIS
jgi:hypothetical protein